MRDFVQPHDPILIQIAYEVTPQEIDSPELRNTIEDILTVSYGNRKGRSKPTVVGLAAPQIGISKRIIAVDTGADGKGGLSNLQIFINPKVVWSSEETEEWYEGCWSTDRVCGIVKRSKSIKIQALIPDGIGIEETYSGYVARIFQHEIDHLNGIEFVHHIQDDNKLHWVEVDEFSEYRNNEAWRNWTKKCPRIKWKKIKSGT